MGNTYVWLWAVPMFSGGVCLASTIWLWGQRRERELFLPVIILVLLAWWGVANGAMMLAPSRELKAAFFLAEGLPVLGVPFLVAWKALLLARPGYKPSRLAISATAGLIIGFVAFSYNDLCFNFLYRQAVAANEFPLPGVTPRLPFWLIFVGVPLVVCAANVLIIARGLPRFDPQNRREGVFYLLGTLFIGGASVLYYGLGITPVPGFDPTPSSVGVGGALVMYSTLRFRLGRSSLWALGNDINDTDVRLFTFQLATFVVIPCGVVFTAVAVDSGSHAAAVTLVLMLTAMPVGFLLMQASKDIRVRERIYAGAMGVVALLFACISIVTTAIEGNLHTLPWALLFPVLVIFGLGHRGGLWSVSIFLAAMALAAHLSGHLESVFLTPLGMRSVIAFLLMTIILGFMEYARHKYLSLLAASQEEIKRHRDSLEGLVDQRTRELNRTISLLQGEVAQRAEAQTALVEARNLAVEANRAKTDFLANMSHELRTPLTHVLGFADVLREGYSGPLNERQKEYLGYVITSANHLHALVNDLLDLAKVDAGKMKMDAQPVCLGTIINDVVRAQSSRAREAKVSVAVSLHDLPAQMELDPHKISQVVTILLTNAVKFSPGGSVKVEAWGRAEGMTGGGPGRDRPHVEIVFSDSGIGIQPADQQRIFRAFEQVDSSTTRQFDGSGLGLALARHYVEMHGGHIWVESGGLGQGSQFHVILPWSPSSPEEGL